MNTKLSLFPSPRTNYSSSGRVSAWGGMGFTLTAGRDGIHLSGAAAGASAIIDGNTIRRTGRQGIHLDQGSIGRIANNVIEDVPGEGIYVLESSNARIGFLIADLGPNAIRNTGTHGIVLRGGSSAWIVG